MKRWSMRFRMGLGILSGAFLLGNGGVAAPEDHGLSEVREIEADLLVVGATESGWAAAIQAARMGVERIVIVHDGEWYGGQFTEQALACVDENKGVGKVGWGVDWHPMKRSFSRSGLFKEVMDLIEARNTERYGSPMPGLPYHGPSTHRPAEAELAFRELIQPYVDLGQIEVFWKRAPVSTRVDRSDEAAPRLLGVNFAPVDLKTGRVGPTNLRVTARLTIDASDWGEVIQLSGTDYEVGPDPRYRYGEPSAPDGLSDFPPNEMNPITWAMIVEETQEAKPIPAPPHYDLRNYPRATRMGMAAFGKELRWDRKLKRYGGILHWPPDGEEAKRQLSVYSVRRIVEGATSRDGRTSILLNYMNGQDYPLERLPKRVADALEETEAGASEKNLVEMTREQRQLVFEDAKQHSLGVLYHLQTWVHDHAGEDTTNSFRWFQLSPEFGTTDSLPPKPYIREGLRLKARYMMREQDGRNRDGEEKTAAKERFAQVMYPDGLFAWQFHYDFHRTGRTYLEGDETQEGPWIDFEKPGRHTRFVSDRSVFPLRSLVPQSMGGLLGAQGNVGFSSIVSAAIRLHDQRIHIGQAAGATAAVSLKEEVTPRELAERLDLIEAVREGLCSESMEGAPLLIWPFRDLAPGDPGFVAANRLAARGLLPLDSREVDFRGSEPVDTEWLGAITEPLFARMKDGKALVGGFTIGTRAELVDQAWQHWRRASPEAPERQSVDDADGDGIPDLEDALWFTPNDPITWSIERAPVTPETDGLVDDAVPATGRWFDFSGREAEPSEGFEFASGHPYDDAAGFGWTNDLSANHRKRKGFPESYRNTFVFTRGQDEWECAVTEGRYRVTVCVGDAEHDQVNQNLALEGEPLLINETTEAGRFLEKSAVVTVKDGHLTVTIGRESGGANTCLVWLIFAREGA